MAKLFMPGEQQPAKNKQPEHHEPEQSSSYNPLSYVAKIPTYAYELLRSNPLSQQLQTTSDYVRQQMELPKTEFRQYVPQEQARQEISNILPEYMTRELPLDWLARGALHEIPVAAVSGGLSSLPNLSKYAVSSLGGYIGGKAGQAAGEAIGVPEAGFLLGGVLGSNISTIMPSKAFKGKVPELYSPEQRQQEYEKAIIKEASAKQVFSNRKLKKIKQLEKEINQKKDVISDLDNKRSTYYQKARNLENNAIGSTEKLKKPFRLLSSKIYEGLDLLDRSQMRALEDSINSGRMSLEDAKAFKEHFNNTIYRKKNPTITRVLMKINNELRDFITDIGSAEHKVAYDKADKLSRRMYEQKHNLNQEIKEINAAQKSERIPFEEQARLKLDIQRAKQNLKPETKTTWQNIKDTGGLWGLSSILFKGLGKSLGIPLGDYIALGTGLYAGGKFLKNEADIFRLVKNKYPEQMKKYIDTMLNATAKNMPLTIKRLNDIAQDIDIDTEMPKKERSGLTMPNDA